MLRKELVQRAWELDVREQELPRREAMLAISVAVHNPLTPTEQARLRQQQRLANATAVAAAKILQPKPAVKVVKAAEPAEAHPSSLDQTCLTVVLQADKCDSGGGDAVHARRL